MGIGGAKASMNTISVGTDLIQRDISPGPVFGLPQSVDISRELPF